MHLTQITFSLFLGPYIVIYSFETFIIFPYVIFTRRRRALAFDCSIETQILRQKETQHMSLNPHSYKFLTHRPISVNQRTVFK